MIFSLLDITDDNFEENSKISELLGKTYKI